MNRTMVTTSESSTATLTPRAAIRPYRVRVPRSVIARITQRVRATKLPEPAAPDDSWAFGMSAATMRDLVSYWTTDYDWYRTEAELNAHPQFLANVDGTMVHFYHVQGARRNATPVVLTHGWPGSVFEFLRVIEPLTHPERFGGDVRQSLTLVIPSLPGFGFAPVPPRETIGPVTTARLWHSLMTRVLGYQRFGVQGGDLGCIVSTRLAHLFPESVIGLHLNLVPPPNKPIERMNDEERQWLQRSAAFRAQELDYFQLMAHKPATMSLVLGDNPVGTAAWMLEKFKLWSDTGVSFEPVFTMHQLISAVMIYLVTGTADSVPWFYRGVLRETQGQSHPGERIKVPTAVAEFPKDLINGRPPRSLVQFGYNLVRYTSMPSGGHFAALEEPLRFARDVGEFFHSLREPARPAS
ncbi:MAG: epoxide hydrolase family protein [bacterium]